jgi:hypothetical protein
MKAKILKVGTLEPAAEGGFALKGWEFAVEGSPEDYQSGDAWGWTWAELHEISRENLTLGRLIADLKGAALRCPNCRGSREWTYTYRGRDNLVPCVRCEAIYQLLTPLEAAWEMWRGEHPY